MVSKEKDLNKQEQINEDMGFFSILSDGRTNLSTRIVRLIQLMFDLTFILLVGFAVIFFYYKSQVGWIFTILAIIRYLTKND